MSFLWVVMMRAARPRVDVGSDVVVRRAGGMTPLRTKGAEQPFVPREGPDVSNPKRERRFHGVLHRTHSREMYTVNNTNRAMILQGHI